MGRGLSTAMNEILGVTERDAQYTLDLSFPDGSSFRFATAPLTVSGRGTYSNDLESVGEIRQTIESSTDRVTVAVQNKDRVLGLHVATYWRKWRQAEAVIGRYYRGGLAGETQAWTEMFSGVVQQPNADDLQVTMDVIADTISKGLIVASRTLGLLCPFKFKDPKTCAYSGPLTTCNHMLKSQGGCEGRDNTEHFGGMEHRNNPDVNIPGTGGNPVEPEIIYPTCPRPDQFVLARGTDGERIAKMACFLTPDDWLWHPIRKKFVKVRLAEIVSGQEIWRIVCDNGAMGFSSGSHPVLWYQDHVTGEPVSNFGPADPVLGYAARKGPGKLLNLRCAESAATGETGDVMRIELEGEDNGDKIYCYGDTVDLFIVCHNAKPWEGGGVFL